MKPSVFMLAMLMIFSVVLVFFPQIGVVKAAGTIYIRDDGSVEGTDKIQRDENVYTLTDNIYDCSISVLKDGVVLDGAGHIVRGVPSGIVLTHRNNVTIKNFTISTSSTSDNIYLYYCSNCTILNNVITPFIESYPGTGIAVWGGASNVIAGNQVMNNLCGIFLGEGTQNNSIFGNSITNNTRGVQIQRSQNNSIYNNNFNNKLIEIHILAGPPETTLVTHFDNGTTGNYWSDYKGTDSNGDGIGGTPYIIDENNRDNFPLMEPVSVIPEFPSCLLLPFFLAATACVVALKKKMFY